MREFDVLVVGAGPAGSAAAYTAARSGLSVALIDKAAFPRDKLCGGLFSGRARKVFATVFERDFDAGLFVENRSVAFWSAGECLGLVEDVPPVYLTMRRSLDHALLKLALAAGARDFTGRRPAAVDVAARCVTLADGQGVRGRVLIGADGVNSPVARALFGSAHDRKKIGFALEAEASGTDLRPDGPVRIDFSAVRGGYGWSFPKPQTTTIGVGGPHVLNRDMKAAMAAYLALNGVAAGSCPVKGHFIPMGDFRRRPGRGAVLLAGDAAGLVDPVTGEGIAHAMESGHYAARSAAEAIRAGMPRSALDLYTPRLRDIHRGLRLARRIRPVIYAPLLQPSFARSFRTSTHLKRLYLDVLAGEAEYPQLFRSVVRRLPRIFWRALLTRP